MAVFNGVVTDVTGTPVNEGDTIAGAFRIGNVAVLRVGKVKGFAERANKLTIRVDWQQSSRREKPVSGAIEAELSRFVKIASAGSVLTATSVPAVTPISESDDAPAAASPGDAPVVNP